MTQRWEATVFAIQAVSWSDSSPSTQRSPLPDPDQGALSTTRCSSVNSRCTSSTLYARQACGCNGRIVERCCSSRIRSNCSSGGSSDWGTPCFNSACLSLASQPQATILSTEPSATGEVQSRCRRHEIAVAVGQAQVVFGIEDAECHKINNKRGRKPLPLYECIPL